MHLLASVALIAQCMQAEDDEPRSEVSNDYDALIASCLALDPEHRPTMNDIVAALSEMAATLGLA